MSWKQTLNEYKNQDNDLMEMRLQICNDCPIAIQTAEYGPICDSRQYINENDEVSHKWAPGFKKGCGCYVKFKAANKDKHCVIDKW